ncbi:hypothetical protein [Pseudomonas fluorescens]|uniref:hypothetical protein n=1 Tax=Pseudomonas fluorescens TaxID=294 RepID=UPI001CA6425A|nr:hypothetical protein [Pseudomonas fluorescens]MBY8934240.1 hypothetical protein [Pseudomonas fluorescens]
MNEATTATTVKCAYCGKPADPVVKREIIDRDRHPATGRAYVRTREMSFCSKEHGSNYQMGCEG